MTVTSTTQSKPQPMYFSDWGLLPFQQEGVLHTYLGDTLAAWDTGTGKSHLGMATAAMQFEDKIADVCLVVCEDNKVDEWVDDFNNHTSIRTLRYGGKSMTATQRKTIVSALLTDQEVKVKRGFIIRQPQVLVGTYETFRNDIVINKTETNARGRKVRVASPGVLSEALKGKRVVLIYDEMTKIGNRGSGTHKAHKFLIDYVRKTGGKTKLLGLTATPIERDPENFYDLGRILCPKEVGTVKSFETDHVQYRDQFGRGTFKNLTRETLTEPWVTPLSEKMASVLIRKRWTDDDVRSQFPEVGSERFVHVQLGDKHKRLYDIIRDTFDEAKDRGESDVGAVMARRMLAGHPMSLLHSEGEIARTIVSQIGPEGLEALGSAKLDVLVARLKPIILGEGAQAVVFTFFGPSMIPLIAARLESEGITVAQNYPGLGDNLRREHLADFKSGNRRVFLSSDAGARGINLPQASYAFEYEMALTHAKRTQRLNRIKRLSSLDAGVDQIYFQSLVAAGTIEEALANKVMARNEWADSLLGDEDAGEHFVSASDRKALLEAARHERQGN